MCEVTEQVCLAGLAPQVYQISKSCSDCGPSASPPTDQPISLGAREGCLPGKALLSTVPSTVGARPACVRVCVGGALVPGSVISLEP